MKQLTAFSIFCKIFAFEVFFFSPSPPLDDEAAHKMHNFLRLSFILASFPFLNKQKKVRFLRT